MAHSDGLGWMGEVVQWGTSCVRQAGCAKQAGPHAARRAPAQPAIMPHCRLAPAHPPVWMTAQVLCR